MRLLLEIALVATLLILGWEKPFNRWLHNSTPVTPTKSTENARPPERDTNSPPRNERGSWMWDESRTTKLDRGPYHHDDNVAHAPQLYPAGSPGYKVDSSGHRYWVDQSGTRHYF